MQPETPPLNDAERTRCEIWTRVMGYHRPLAYWNPGKQSEHRERQYFSSHHGLSHNGPSLNGQSLNSPSDKGPSHHSAGPRELNGAGNGEAQGA